MRYPFIYDSYQTPHPGMPMHWMMLMPTCAMKTKKNCMKLKELSLLKKMEKIQKYLQTQTECILLSAWSLHVLPVSRWVFSASLPQSKDMQADSKLSLSMNVSVTLCQPSDEHVYAMSAWIGSSPSQPSEG